MRTAMGHLGRASSGPADPQPLIKRIGGSADHQNLTCWCAKRARRVYTLQPGAVNGTGNRLCPHAGPQGAARQPRIAQGPKNTCTNRSWLPSAWPRTAGSVAAPGSREGRGESPGIFLTPEPRPAAHLRRAAGGTGPPTDQLLPERASWLAGCCGNHRQGCCGSGPTPSGLAGWVLRERADWLAGLLAARGADGVAAD